MGVNLPSSLKVAGFPWSSYKKVLARFLSPAPLARFFGGKKEHFGNNRLAAIALHECLERHLLVPAGQSEFGLSDAGLAVVTGKLLKRFDIAVADRVVEELLQRIAKFNADPIQVTVIDEVWLYGSYIRREDTVGDVDGAVSVSLKPGLSWQDRAKQVKAIVKANPENFPHQIWLIDWENVTERMIFGRARHPALSGVKLHTHSLKSLHCPCQRVYSLADGGRVHESIEPHFPGSEGRHPEVRAPLPQPDFTPGPLRPLRLDWLTGCQDFAYPLYPLKGTSLRESVRQGLSYDSSICVMDDDGYDASLIITQGRHQTPIRFVRTISARRNTIVYDYGAYSLNSKIKGELRELAGAILASAVGNDLEMIVRRARELSQPVSIEVKARMLSVSEDYDLRMSVSNILLSNLAELLPSLGETDSLTVSIKPRDGVTIGSAEAV